LVLARLADAAELLIPAGAEQGEVADADGRDAHLLEPAPDVALADDGARAGDLLVTRQGDAGGVGAGLVEERLVPGDERDGLPALLAVDGQDGQPVAEVGDALPLAPAAHLVREADGHLEEDGDALAGLDG